MPECNCDEELIFLSFAWHCVYSPLLIPLCNPTTTSPVTTTAIPWVIPYYPEQPVTHLSLKNGFYCLNSEQPEGKTCSDYAISFCCPVEELTCKVWIKFSNIHFKGTV